MIWFPSCKSLILASITYSEFDGIYSRLRYAKPEHCKPPKTPHVLRLQVFTALRQGQLHIPYRNSKLTHLLQPSLGGDAKVSRHSTEPRNALFGTSQIIYSMHRAGSRKLTLHLIIVLQFQKFVTSSRALYFQFRTSIVSALKLLGLEKKLVCSNAESSFHGSSEFSVCK